MRRCRQCGRPMDENDRGNFCSSGCRHAFERENPGQLEKEEAKLKKVQGCFIAIVVIIILLLIFGGIGK